MNAIYALKRLPRSMLNNLANRQNTYVAQSATKKYKIKRPVQCVDKKIHYILK